MLVIISSCFFFFSVKSSRILNLTLSVIHSQHDHYPTLLWKLRYKLLEPLLFFQRTITLVLQLPSSLQALESIQGALTYCFYYSTYYVGKDLSLKITTDNFANFAYVFLFLPFLYVLEISHFPLTVVAINKLM